MNKSYAIGIDIYGIEHRFEMNSYNDIWCHYSDLKSLIVYDEDNQLNDVYCYRNQLESLTIIGGKNIIEIECWKNNLTSLNLSMCEKLEYLYCDFIEDKNIKLPNKKLNYIYFY